MKNKIVWYVKFLMVIALMQSDCLQAMVRTGARFSSAAGVGRYFGTGATAGTNAAAQNLQTMNSQEVAQRVQAAATQAHKDATRGQAFPDQVKVHPTAAQASSAGEMGLINRFAAPADTAAPKAMTNKQAIKLQEQLNTELQYFATRGYTEMVQKLLAQGANPDTDNVLVDAINFGHADVVKVLLDHGAHANQHSVMRAIQKSRSNVVKVLLDHGVPATDNAIVYAVDQGNKEMVKELLDHGANPNATHSVTLGQGEPILLDAIKQGNAELVKLLLEKGANPNIALDHTATSSSLLDTALEQGNTTIVQALLDHGADLSPKTSAEQTQLLKKAFKMGNPEIVKALLDKGMDATGSMKDLYEAAHNGHVNIIKSLLKDGKHDGQDLLREAIAKDDAAAVQTLIHAGVDVNVPVTTQGMEGGVSLLHHAAINNSGKAIKALITVGGIDPNITLTENSRTPLHIAAIANSPNAAQALLDAGADMHQLSKDGYTPEEMARHVNPTGSTADILRRAQDAHIAKVYQEHQAAQAEHPATSFSIFSLFNR